ncbi:MAG: sugar kinase [Nitriliruptorales bacterium]|nr:sugar kinase [Nitriliruptorales bacterium]
MTGPSVLVVGDAATDVISRMREPLAAGSDAVASIVTSEGGSGANVACWLAAQGVDAHFIGRIGADPQGLAQTAALRRQGVTPHLAVDGDRSTGVVIVLVGADGSRSMVSDRGANLTLSPADIPVELFQPPRHLHLSGYALLSEGSRQAALHALRLARERGLTVSVDPSSAQPLRTAGADRFLDWTYAADLCLPNLDEALVLSGQEGAESAAAALAAFYGEVVVTMGAEGSLWTDGGSPVRAAAAPAPSVVDTTGAGDAFCAGFLASWLGGVPPAGALTAGARLAARAVARVGARPPRS